MKKKSFLNYIKKILGINCMKFLSPLVKVLFHDTGDSLKCGRYFYSSLFLSFSLSLSLYIYIYIYILHRFFIYMCKAFFGWGPFFSK